jgi:hypothetical protein
VQENKPPKCFYDDDRELIEKALSILYTRDAPEFRRLAGC